MRYIGCLLGVVTILVSYGCQRNTGWVIKPVPVDQKLEETTVATAPGLLAANKIAVVDVEGLILNRRGGLFNQRDNPVSLFIEKVDRAQSDPAVKAVIVRINSPGGGVTASDLMYRRLLRLREEKHVPVVAAIQDVGASGAYYIACGCDEIITHPTSVTGSIGVIVQTISFAGSMQKLGITAQAITSGPRKDMGSPLKPLNAEDQAILQNLVNEFYQRFLAVVTKGRPNMTAEQVKQLADGRIYTGEQAKANGLADELGDMNDSILRAKQLAKTPRAKVVMYHRPMGYQANVYSETATPQPLAELPKITMTDIMAFARPEFLYLWTGN